MECTLSPDFLVAAKPVADTCRPTNTHATDAKPKDWPHNTDGEQPQEAPHDCFILHRVDGKTEHELNKFLAAHDLRPPRILTIPDDKEKRKAISSPPDITPNQAKDATVDIGGEEKMRAGTKEALESAQMPLKCLSGQCEAERSMYGKRAAFVDVPWYISPTRGDLKYAKTKNRDGVRITHGNERAGSSAESTRGQDRERSHNRGYYHSQHRGRERSHTAKPEISEDSVRYRQLVRNDSGAQDRVERAQTGITAELAPVKRHQPTSTPSHTPMMLGSSTWL